MLDEQDKQIDLRWLTDTYWYVPPGGLPAQRFDSSENTLSWQVDQTVWHITGQEQGYFWGVTSAVLYPAGQGMPSHGPGSSPSYFTLLGTLTPSGQVQMTFVPSSGPGSATLGFGQMVERDGAWAFEMQMSTGQMGTQTLHWAYMVQTHEGDPSWEQLPGLPYSVPQMLEGATYPTVEPVDSET